ncbi:tRNA (guanosine(46)-N7)-methyltransferase TrmB [Hyphobacterium sp. HN65]|uniref:tRNA (guanine-N(7)-)-methyltransferase n=1 Tax=Hyphobacterium lacteum TaxID=3116575 RepID=A0ABU7LS04_9PROT|nr:tRNA (guanosine(46)-N7)-methyltransferase TrmB [Hyphobacterium sp. HN65]MEE2526697.1 tRNA (guanosine(46)-N7)-methyltransferase TrmB [Hyphobacterium sp. HN65]
MSSKPSPEDKRLRTFGRTKSRTLSARQQALVDAFLPRIAIPETGPVIPADLVPAKREYVLEIGFGGGEHLSGQAARNPDTGYLGVEPFINGVAKALTQIDEAGLTNVRLFEGDAREVMERMPDQCLDRIFLLFPDPWPKARHAKRRFVQDETAAEFVRVLKPRGALRVATDVKAYADHALWILRGHPDLEWQAKAAADWREPPADHLTTRYETKKLGDCAPVFFDFVRV